MTDRDVWTHMLVNVADYARRLQKEGPLPHRPPRSSPRIGCSLPIRLLSPHVIAAVAVDFSAAGLRLRLDSPISTQLTYDARIVEHPAEPDLNTQLRAMWSRTGPDGVHEAGCEFVGFDKRSPEDVARFFETHPGLTRDIATIPRTRTVESGPPVMLSGATEGIRKCFLLKLTRGGMSAASHHLFEAGVDVEMTMPLSTGLLRANGVVMACRPLPQHGYSRIEVRFNERLAAEHLHALLPILMGESGG